MMRILWGSAFILVGALFALQTFGVLPIILPFWPIVLTILGAYLFVRGLLPSPFRWRTDPAWFKMSLGVWLACIGVFDILHANGISALAGRDVWSVGWFILLIGAGLALIFGGRNGNRRIKVGRGWHWIIGSDFDDYPDVLGMGDLHYGREPWFLDRQLTVKHAAGDVRVDLSTAEMAEGAHQVDVSVGAGEVVILVPDNCNANVRAGVGTGGIRIFDKRRDGIGVKLETSQHVADATVTLNINVRLKVGQVTVRRVPSRQQEG